jgi:hypothetical protein
VTHDASDGISDTSTLAPASGFCLLKVFGSGGFAILNLAYIVLPTPDMTAAVAAVAAVAVCCCFC